MALNPRGRGADALLRPTSRSPARRCWYGLAMRAWRALTCDRTAVTVLVTPVFLGSVAVLLTNDHILKRTFPGLLTGKISDFAGPVMIAIAASVAVGRRAGFALTAAGFVALKTVPGVAEAAAPVMGGVTLRDPSDIVGLLALPLAWRWLSRRSAACVSPSDRSHLPRGGGAGPTATPCRSQPRALPLGAAALALVALTATSPLPDPPEVVSLSVSGSTVYAEITTAGYPEERREWARSTDGGRSWTRVEGGVPADADPAPGRACRADGTCFDTTGGSIQETRPDGSTKTSFELSGSQRAALDHRRAGQGADPDDMFIHVAVVPGLEGESVVATARDQGVVVLGPSGGWQRVAVLGAEPTSLAGSVLALNIATGAFFFSLPIAFVATVATALTRQHRNGWVKAGIVVAAVAFGGLFWASGVVVWAVGSFNRADPTIMTILLTLLGLATLFVPISAVRASGKPRPAESNF